MYIYQTNNYKSTGFSARKKEIKTADDIQRSVKRTFPMTSSSYFDSFSSLMSEYRSDDIAQIAYDIVIRLDNKIRKLRKESESSNGINYSNQNVIFAKYLKNIKKEKCGNCFEASIATYSALLANGFYDSKIVDLYIESTFKNKKTGKIEFKTINPIDHTFVVSTMNKNIINPQNMIILDTWLGFTGDYTYAKAKFNSLLQENSINRSIKNNECDFLINKFNKRGKFNIEDYEIKNELIFKESILFYNSNPEIFGKYIARKYKELVKFPKKELS